LNQIRQLNKSEAGGSQNPNEMAEADEKGCLQNDLIVNVKHKVKPRFKAGAELSSSVNAVDIGWDENHECDSTTLDFHIHLKAEECAAK
jgi:hypothetical protein